MANIMKTFPGRSPAVPQELVDIIIDHSHSDRQLATCALVCKSWVSSSRYHLFNSIAIRQDNALAFVDLLESKDITFLPYLQDITFTHRKRGGNAFDDSNASRVWLIANVLPQLLTHSLVSVKSIAFDFEGFRGGICGLSFSDREAELLTNLPSSCPNVTNLEFRSVEFDSFESVFFKCVSKFTRLEHLTLMTDSFCEPTIDYVKHPPPIQLQSLALELLTSSSWATSDGDGEPNMSSLVQVLDWITSGGRKPKIQRLRVSCTEPHGVASIGTFLCSLGDNLQALDLTFYSSCNRGAYCHSIPS